MNIKIYTGALELEGIIDNFDTFIWVSRYWNVGEFSIYAAATDYNLQTLKVGYIAIKHDGENERLVGYTKDGAAVSGLWHRAGLIESVRLFRSAEGEEFVEAKGQMLAGMLSRRVCVRQLALATTTKNVLLAIVGQNAGPDAAAARRFEDFQMLPPSGTFPTTTFDYGNELFADLGDEVQRVACDGKVGYDILANVTDRIMGFFLYVGTDYSSDTQGDEILLFSRTHDNVENVEIVTSDTALKTYAYVGGSNDDNFKMIWAETGSGSGRARREIYIAAQDLQQKYSDAAGNQVTIPLATYLSMLRNKGDTELKANSAERLSFTATIKERQYAYGRDFTVGDVVTCRDEKMGIQVDVRITEVKETYKSQDKEIEIAFGDAIPAAWALKQQIRKVR